MEEPNDSEVKDATELQWQQAPPIEVTLRLPGPDERGFLRRIREVQEIMGKARTDGVLGLFDMWDAFAAYLVGRGYVEVPPGIDPRDAVQELSRAELNHAFSVLAGIELPKAVDPPNGA